MTPERWQKLKPLLEAALALEQGARSAFLEQACAGDVELKSEIEAIMMYDKKADHFLEDPIINNDFNRELQRHGLPENQFAGGPVLEQLPGQLLDDKYRIEKKLGQGGMGAV